MLISTLCPLTNKGEKMTLTYNNHVADGYEYKKNISPEFKEVIHSVGTYNENWNKRLSFDTTNDNENEMVFLELAKANTIEKAIIFFNKYGSLVNLKTFSAPTENYHYPHTLQALDDIFENKHDAMAYDHFLFYQKEMKSLVEIHSLLTSIKHSKSKSPKKLQDLLLECMEILCNPCFSSMFFLEFNETQDDEIMHSLFNNYPLFDYRYAMFLDNHNKKPKNFQLECTHNYSSLYSNNDILFLIEAIKKLYHGVTKTKNIPLSDKNTIFLSETMEKLHQGVIKIENNLYINDFLSKHHKELINLAQNIFKQFLGFYISEIYPLPTSPSNQNGLIFHYPSLISTIFFYFNLFCSEGSEIKHCENEYCNKLFICPVSRKNQKIYCSKTCAHRVTNRKYKKKHKNQ